MELYHGSHLQSAGEGLGSGHDVGRATVRKGAVDEGDVVANRNRAESNEFVNGAGF